LILFSIFTAAEELVKARTLEANYAATIGKLFDILKLFCDHTGT
jgi:hypothetical protein